MNITNAMLDTSAKRAAQLIDQSKQRVQQMLQPENAVPVAQQLATFEKVQANPALAEKVKKQHGEDGYARYVEAMNRLKQAGEQGA